MGFHFSHHDSMGCWLESNPGHIGERFHHCACAIHAPPLNMRGRVLKLNVSIQIVEMAVWLPHLDYCSRRTHQAISTSYQWRCSLERSEECLWYPSTNQPVRKQIYVSLVNTIEPPLTATGPPQRTWFFVPNVHQSIDITQYWNLLQRPVNQLILRQGGRVVEL